MVFADIGKILQAIITFILTLFGKGPPTCTINGPVPTNANTLVRFIAFGDTPYDGDSSPPSYMGSEYTCLQNTIIPGIKNGLTGTIDFVGHIGDIMVGGLACTNTLFGSRQSLFGSFETQVDFLLIPGDNEWNQCPGYNNDPTVSDAVKVLWRQNFAQGAFADFDFALPYGGNNIIIERDPAQLQNFFFYYDTQAIAFFGLTEPEDDNAYNPINAAFVQSKLSNRSPKAVVVFGHATMSNNVQTVLPPVPTLYVTGNLHKFCAVQMDNHPNSMSVTVANGKAAPLLFSIVVDNSGTYAFHYESTPYGCPS